MALYRVSANGRVFGEWDASNGQDARDQCAREAGYESEADMVERLEQPSELEAELIPG